MWSDLSNAIADRTFKRMFRMNKSDFLTSVFQNTRQNWRRGVQVGGVLGLSAKSKDPPLPAVETLGVDEFGRHAKSQHACSATGSGC